VEVVPFTPDREEQWDALVERAPMATFLHSRRFLSYHRDRFEDASVLLLDDAGDVRGAVPAAIDPGDARRVVSHPGATYGGLVHEGGLNGDRARDALLAVRAHYAGRDLDVLRYKPVPHVYHRSPSADDVWALSELGATRAWCDLSCAIDLASRRAPSSRRRRSLAKARRAGVEVAAGPETLAAFWPVLDATLERRHAVRPVHTFAEIEELRARFPDRILPLVALLDGRVVAGTVLFATHTTVHTQYLAASEEGAEVSALDAVLERGIELAVGLGARFYDLGISPGEGRRGLIAGLYRYKAEFGGGGVVHEHYDWPLR
jgi:CelD/BcsL family acetyltransferase involved in cellulose biosynthesis